MRVDVQGRTSMKEKSMQIQRVHATPEWWCRTMHSKVSRPRDNFYQCLECGRVYLVPWIDPPRTRAEPAPGGSMYGRLNRFLGLVRAAIVARPHLPGHVGTAGDGI